MHTNVKSACNIVNIERLRLVEVTSQEPFRPQQRWTPRDLRHSDTLTLPSCEGEPQRFPLKIDKNLFPPTPKLRFKHGSTDQLVAENVTHGSDGVFRCAIAGPGSCPFALPKMIQFTFACHFLRSHPKEAEEKGFLEESRAPTKSQPAALGHFVVRTERGFCCRIDPSLTCAYVQKDQVSAQNFTRHFRLAHPALARKHGFYQVLQSHEGRSILNTMVQRSVEKSTADDSEQTSQKRKLTEDDDDSGESSSDVIVLNPGDEKEWMNT